MFSRSIEACAHYGNLVTLLDPGPGIDWKEARIRNLSIHFTLMLTPWLRGLETHWARQNDILRRCATWFDEGRLQVRLGQVYPLAEAAAAHRQIEAGHVTGKQVLTV